MKILGVIPARLKSTRLPEKMLADVGGKPLLYYTWKQVKKVKLLDEVVVATDSIEILKAVEAFGGVAMMTSRTHQSGSDRVAEVARKFKKFKPDIIVNIQGDEPLISPSAIRDAAQVLVDHKDMDVGSVLTPLSKQEEIDNPSITKVVINKDSEILYCSRSAVPYPRNPYKKYLKQVGIYAFRPKALQEYVKLRQLPLEIAEGLEQLRLLEHGRKIKVCVGNYQSISVDTPADLQRVRKILTK